jgi:hypothetical protein
MTRPRTKRCGTSHTACASDGSSETSPTAAASSTAAGTRPDGSEIQRAAGAETWPVVCVVGAAGVAPAIAPNNERKNREKVCALGSWVGFRIARLSQLEPTSLRAVTFAPDSLLCRAGRDGRALAAKQEWSRREDDDDDAEVPKAAYGHLTNFGIITFTRHAGMVTNY